MDAEPVYRLGLKRGVYLSAQDHGRGRKQKVTQKDVPEIQRGAAHAHECRYDLIGARTSERFRYGPGEATKIPHSEEQPPNNERRLKG